MKREESLRVVEEQDSNRSVDEAVNEAVDEGDDRERRRSDGCDCEGLQELEQSPLRAEEREAVVAEALGDRGGGEILQSVLSLVRRNAPGSSQVILRGVSGRAALKVLRERTEVCEGLGSAIRSCVSTDDEVIRDYFGWHSFCWSVPEGEVSNEGVSNEKNRENVEGEEAVRAEGVEMGEMGEMVKVVKVVEMISLPSSAPRPSPPHLSWTLVFVSHSEKAARDAAATIARISRIPKSRYQVFSGGMWSEAPKFEREVSEVSFEDVVLPEETISAVRNSVERFFERREDYEKLGFAWKRGILLVGPTGTGKTMLTKAIAQSKPDIPFLYVRDLEAMGAGRSISQIFTKARSLAPAILALEDIDGLVNGATRSLFLNELDGFTNNDGLLVIASSNHPERIDEALLKRPSRFDRVFHIGFPSLAERERYLKKLLTQEPLLEKFSSREEAEKAARQLAQRSEGLAPTHIKEAVISEALELRELLEGEQQNRDFSEGVLIQIEKLKRSIRSADTPEDLGRARPADRSMGFESGL